MCFGWAEAAPCATSVPRWTSTSCSPRETAERSSRRTPEIRYEGRCVRPHDMPARPRRPGDSGRCVPVPEGSRIELGEPGRSEETVAHACVLWRGVPTPVPEGQHGEGRDHRGADHRGERHGWPRSRRYGTALAADRIGTRERDRQRLFQDRDGRRRRRDDVRGHAVRHEANEDCCCATAARARPRRVRTTFTPGAVLRATELSVQACVGPLAASAGPRCP